MSGPGALRGKRPHRPPAEHVERIRKALQDNGKEFEIIVYENTIHAFANDGKVDTYEPNAAKLAWERSLEFLAKHLKG